MLIHRSSILPILHFQLRREIEEMVVGGPQLNNVTRPGTYGLAVWIPVLWRGILRIGCPVA